MSGPEIIAVIRDLTIIVTAGVFIVILVSAGILGFRLYRLVSRVGQNVENIIRMLQESVVRPLTALPSMLESVNHAVNHIVGLVKRRSPERSVENAGNDRR